MNSDDIIAFALATIGLCFAVLVLVAFYGFWFGLIGYVVVSIVRIVSHALGVPT